MRVFLAFLGIIFSFGIYSQIQMKNLSLVTPDSAVAYTYDSNLLEFTGVSQSKAYTLICNEDTISKSSINRFNFSPKKKGIQTLQLFENNKLIEEFQIRVERLGRLKIHLGELKDSVVSTLELINNLYFVVTYAPQLSNPCTSVMACDISIQKENGELIQLMNRYSSVDKNINRLIYLKEIVEYANQEGKDVKFLENYINDEFSEIHLSPLFYLHDVVKIAQLEDGDVFIVNTVTTRCPTCKALRREVDLRYTIKNH